MFQHMHMPENPELPLLDLPVSDNALFASQPSPRTAFRTQRLETYLASNLFNANYLGKSTFLYNQNIASMIQDKKLRFTGESFDQWDLDVLLYCALNTPTQNDHSRQLQFSPAELLHAVGLRNNAPNQQKVYDSLQRLHTGVITIEGKDYQYMTRLINRVLVDTHQAQCLVEVNGDVVKAIHATDVATEADIRWSLGRNGIAKWLHGTLMAFKGGHSGDIESLLYLCSPTHKTMRLFDTRLKKALELLAFRGAILTWNLDDTHVQVTTHNLGNNNSTCGLFFPNNSPR